MTKGRATAAAVATAVALACAPGCGDFDGYRVATTGADGGEVLATAPPPDAGGAGEGEGEGGGADTSPSATCAEAPCRAVLPQCGCPAGQGCYPSKTLALECAPAGTATESAPCNGPHDCKPGHACLAINGDVTFCVRLCESKADCVRPTATCIGRADGRGGINVCTSACDPIANTGCPAGTMCGVMVGPAWPVSMCRQTGTLPMGASCAVEACAPGLACVGSICRKICRADAPCPTGYACVIGPPYDIDGQPYGVCNPR